MSILYAHLRTGSWYLLVPLPRYLLKSPSLQGQWTTQTGEDLWHIRRPFRSIQVLTLLLNNYDLKLALQLATTMQERFWGTQYESAVEKAVAYAHGLVAYYKRDYASAYKLFKKSQVSPMPIEHNALYAHANQFLVQQLWGKARYEDALQVAIEGVNHAPKNLAALFNAGTLLLISPDNLSSKWRQYLETFISLGKKNPEIVSSHFIDIADSALANGKMTRTKPLAPLERPPLLDPLSLY